jgi:hypothetical protein
MRTTEGEAARPGALRGSRSAFRRQSNVRFGFAQTGDTVALFPLTSPLKHFEAFKTFEHIPFAAQGGRRAQTSML